MKRGTIETKMATELLQAGLSYKSDLLLFGRAVNDNQSGMATKALKKLTEEGLVSVRQIKRENNSKKYKEAVSLTVKGKKAVLDVLDEEFMYKHHKEFGTEFHTSSSSSLRLRLLDVRIKLLFVSAGIPAHRSQKPSLSKLVSSLGGRGINISETSGNMYRNDFSDEEIGKMINTGIYYSIKEVRDFLDEQAPGTSDTTLRSRARGIFISNDKCVVVYISPVGNNRIMRMYPDGERTLVSKLKEIIDVTDATRGLISLTKKEQTQSGGYNLLENMRRGEVYAMMITDTEAMVYAMATGNKNGITRNVDMEELQQKKKRSAEKSKKKTRYTWLTGNRDLYRRVFVIPFNYDGVVSLEYLCETSAEVWQQTSSEIISRCEGITPRPFDPIHPGYFIEQERSCPVIFMPVYEVSELADMSRDDFKHCVITFSEMMEPIAHSLKKETVFYDAETYQKVKRDAVLIYDRNGYPKGKRMLEQKLKAMNLTCKPSEYTMLPVKYQKDYVSFYNGIARKEIDINEAITFMDVMPDEKKEEKEVKEMQTISFRVGEEFYEKIKQAARYYELSVTAYIRRIISGTVNEDVQKAKDHIKKEREIWNM